MININLTRLGNIKKMRSIRFYLFKHFISIEFFYFNSQLATKKIKFELKTIASKVLTPLHNRSTLIQRSFRVSKNA